jgi:hypothetical protein
MEGSWFVVEIEQGIEDPGELVEAFTFRACSNCN